MIDALQRLLEPIRRRLALLMGKGIVTLSKEDQGNQRLQVQLLADEVRDDMERLQEYGFTSRPLSGAEAVVLFPNGSRELGLVIAIDDRRYRLQPLEEGEVALYTDEGDKVHMKRGGTIEIVAASMVKVDSPAIELGSGTLEKLVNGEAFQTLFNNHVHTGNLGAPTSPPMNPMTPSHLSQTVKAAT